jgi:hypothetical protein
MNELQAAKNRLEYEIELWEDRRSPWRCLLARIDELVEAAREEGREEGREEVRLQVVRDGL